MNYLNCSSLTIINSRLTRTNAQTHTQVDMPEFLLGIASKI